MIFHLDKTFDEKFECPLVRYDYYSPNYPQFNTWLEFTSNKLSSKEQKVFEAWERNANSDPVK